MRLIAMIPVLYLAHQYSAGDELPVNDQGMIDAWIHAGSAVWENESQVQPAKATPASALAGMPGISDSGIEDDLAGRIPDTPERKVSKSRRKKQ